MNDCGTEAPRDGVGGGRTVMAPLPMFQPDDAPCCGPPPAPPSSALEKPGYSIRPFVAEFLDAPVGPVPRVKTRLDKRDWLGALGARIGGTRSDYKIAPGLYAAGRPGDESPVLVTSNYKLTFDALRRELDGLNAWLLVLDARGVNVWCAAGKGLFGTEELVRRIALTGLDRVVAHRKLVLPQLGATGVSSRQVKKDSGFEVVWGPIRARDVKKFLQNGLVADPGMRLVSFSPLDRAVLVPIEVSHLIKPALLLIAGLFLVSGLGVHVFSLGEAWRRGLMAMWGVLGGVLAGAVVAPILLPWIPGTAFSFKGALAGLVAGLATAGYFWDGSGWLDKAALVLLAAVLGSYLTMNFTGSTPFTSPSGVEKEMRRAIPLQVVSGAAALVLWISSGFLS
ncbi:MAG: mercury methylation corrinoid protein HgcA [Pseudomonadota bacterium]